MNSTFSIDPLKHHLTAAILWCDRHATLEDTANSLRTPALRLQTEKWQLHLDELVISVPEWLSLVSDVIAQRERQLRVDGVNLSVEAKNLEDGRLLFFQPSASGHDGASQDASAGYFDYVDAPPWDTWVWFVEKELVTKLWGESDGGFLVSWVPSLFVNLVQKGIDVNTTDCIKWAAEVDTPFTDLLRRTGWIV